MHEGPTRQNGAGNLLFVTWGVRDGASQSARRYDACKQPLSLLGFGQFERGAAMIRTAQISSTDIGGLRRPSDYEVGT